MGGSVSAPAPDPALLNAQVQSLQSQADIGRRTLANAEQLAPIQREQMQFGLDTGKQAYQQTQEDRAYALQKRGQYDQALNATLNENDKFDEASRRQELMQQAQSDIARQYGEAEKAQQRGLERAGVAPGSGKALMAGQQAQLAEAEARSRAGLMVTEAAKKEGLQLKGQDVAMLAGYPAVAASLTPSGAALGAGGLNIANTAGEGMNQGLGAADKAVAAYGASAGDQWAAANKLYLGSQAAAQEGRSEEIGAGLGLAGMAGFKGISNYGKTGSFLDSGATPTSRGNFGKGLSRLSSDFGW